MHLKIQYGRRRLGRFRRAIGPELIELALEVTRLRSRRPVQSFDSTRRNDRLVKPALERREIGACFDMRVVVRRQRQLPARQHPTERGTRSQEPPLIDPLLQALLRSRAGSSLRARV